MSYYVTERQLRRQNEELRCLNRRWRAIALMLFVLLLACAIVIVLQYQKLP